MNETSSLRRRFGRLASVVMATGLLLWPGGRLAAADLQLSAHLSQAASGLIVDLHLAGSRGQIYEVQASDDLKKWVTVGVGLASASGEVNVQDLGAENYPHRFYRALLVDATTPPQFAVSAGLGLRATVDQGKLTAADGSVIELGGGSVTLLLNTVNYVCLDLFDLQLHVLSRFIHSGAVLVATVTTDAASVKSISQFTVGTLPATRLPKTQHKLNLGQPVQVLLLGDSLTDGFGTEVPARWAQLLFSTNSVTNRWSLLTKAPTLGYRNLGVGGTTARYGMSAVGQIIGPNNQGQRADHPNQAIYRTPYNDARSGESPRTFASPLLSDTPDLLIINFGANTTAGESVFLETTVREFRRKGAEVIIQTGNSRSDGLTPLLDSGATIKGIADAQSCAVADTWAYVHEANDAGLNTYADFVHQNARGYQLYAEATRSVLNDLPQAAAPVSASDDRFTAPTFALPNRVPNITQVQFTPARTTGTRIPVRNPQLSPVVTLGRQNDAVGAIQLNSGQYATYASSRILAVDIIIENQEGEDALLEVSTVFGSYLIKTVPIKGYPLAWQQVPLLTATDIQGIAKQASYYSDFNKLATSLGIRLTCSAGLVRVVGVVFYTFQGTDVPFESMTFGGAWGAEPAALDSPSWRFSETINDQVTIPFTGNGVEVWLHGGITAGLIAVTVDGAPVTTGFDLYRVTDSSPLLYSLKVFPNNLNFSKPITGNYGTHTLQVQMVDVNTNAVPSVPSKNRRFAVYGAQALDTR